MRVVPTCVTEGWHGMRSKPLFMRANTVQYSIRHVSETPENYQMTNQAPAFFRLESSDDKPMARLSRAARGIHNMLSHIRKSDPLLDILSQQRLGGGFNMNRRICDILQISDSKLHSIADDMQMKNGADRLEILTTAIILAFLELKLGDRRDEWEAVVSKSQRELEDQIKNVNPTIDGKPLLEWVKKFMKEKLIAL